MSNHIAIKMYESDGRYEQYLLELIVVYLGEKLGHIKDRNELKNDQFACYPTQILKKRCTT